MNNKIIGILAALLLVSVLAQAADVQISWTANTESDMAGYEVFYGTQSGVYGAPVVIQDKSATSYLLTLPAPTMGQVFYFALRAFDTSGNRSGYSTEASAFIPDVSAPGAPKGLLIVVRVE